jgi:O-antigen ligase
MLYLIFSYQTPKLNYVRNAAILFLLVLLLMSSSKLFVLLMIIPLVWYFLQKLHSRKNHIISLALVILILIIGGRPVMDRFANLQNIDFKVISEESYSYDTPLNGISLRLIQWRLAFEILEENDAWIIGLGQSNTQDILDDKYREVGLYTGNDELNDKGYLGYNFHNQFVETMVSSGSIGLILLLFLIILVVAKRKMLIFPNAVLLITILFFISESVIERQAGILVFSIIICYAPHIENNKTITA